VIGAVRPPTNPNYGKVLPKRLDEWRKTVAHYWGDFWPLTPYSLKNDVWMAWQFDRPEEGQGVVQAFRRQDCPQESITLKLRGLDPKARYELQNLDEKGSHEMTSKELLESGLPVSAKDRPSAIIILYKRISQQ
jgi:alpha-galactosidase